jgi:cytochrome c peroxidase
MSKRRSLFIAVLAAGLVLLRPLLPTQATAWSPPGVRRQQEGRNAFLQPPLRVTLYPAKDNTLYEDETGSVSNGTGVHFFAGNNNLREARRGVIAFDLAGAIPPGSTITAVTLRLYLSRTNTVAWPIALHRLLSDWGEGSSNAAEEEGAGTRATTGSATWLHTFFPEELWATPGGDFSPAASATAVVGGIGYYTWGPTPAMISDVQDWLDTPEGNFGWLLLGKEDRVQTTKRFDSRENAEPANRPVLIVDYVWEATPELSVSKTADIQRAEVGQTIAYTYQVSNSGAVPLLQLRADDDRLGPLTLGHTALAPGESTSAVLTHTVSTQDLPGPLVNTVWVSATVSDTLPVPLVITATARALVELAGHVIYLPIVRKGGSPLSPKEQLGKSIFFDDNLSINGNLSCSDCHAPEVGWSGPLSEVNAHGAVYEGSIASRFGNRRPTSAAYATFSPVLHVDESLQFVGGNFWDGRATGERLGNPAADQAQGPFLNPVEQAFPDSACVVYRVCVSSYPISLPDVWGAAACDITWPQNVEVACATEGSTVALAAQDRDTSDLTFDRIALSIAAFEASAEVNAFSSKFDYVLKDLAELTEEEQLGLTLFQGQGKCHKCHTHTGPQPLFTDFTFANLGIPQNPENPAGMAPDFVDAGLGAFLENAGYAQEVYDAEWGRIKTPTLRNVDLRPDGAFSKAYGHNGYFKTLLGIVHFYNTRDVKPVCPGPYSEAQALAAGCWPAAEVTVNMNTAEMGNLGLTSAEEEAIVAFLKTLSDGYRP